MAQVSLSRAYCATNTKLAMSSALSTKKATPFEDGTTPPAQPYSVRNLRGSIAQSSAGDSLPHMSKAEKKAQKTRMPSDSTAGIRARTLDTTQWHTDNCGKHTCHATCNCKHALPTSTQSTPGSHFVPSKCSPRGIQPCRQETRTRNQPSPPRTRPANPTAAEGPKTRYSCSGSHPFPTGGSRRAQVL